MLTGSTLRAQPCLAASPVASGLRAEVQPSNRSRWTLPSAHTQHVAACADPSAGTHLHPHMQGRPLEGHPSSNSSSSSMVGHQRRQRCTAATTGTARRTRRCTPQRGCRRRCRAPPPGLCTRSSRTQATTSRSSWTPLPPRTLRRRRPQPRRLRTPMTGMTCAPVLTIVLTTLPAVSDLLAACEAPWPHHALAQVSAAQRTPTRAPRPGCHAVRDKRRARQASCETCFVRSRAHSTAGSPEACSRALCAHIFTLSPPL